VQERQQKAAPARLTLLTVQEEGKRKTKKETPPLPFEQHPHQSGISRNSTLKNRIWIPPSNFGFLIVLCSDRAKPAKTSKL
jgi:hypothetical protein